MRELRNRRASQLVSRASSLCAPGSPCQTIASLAREHDVSRGAICTAVADLMPGYTAGHQDAPAPEVAVTLDVPGTVADFLRMAELDPPSGPRSVRA